MKKSAKTLTILALLVGGALLGMLALANRGSAKVEVVPIVPSQAKVVLALTGRLEPIKEASVSSSLTATRIAEVLVDLGDRVQKGQVLVRLDTSQLQSQRDQAEASLESARASLAKARAALQGARESVDISQESYREAVDLRASRDQAVNNVNIQEQSVKVAQAKLAKVKAGGRPEEARRAEAALVSAKASLTERGQNLDRQQALYDKGYVAKVELEKAQLGFSTAQQEVLSAEANLEQVKQPRLEDVVEAEASLDQALASLKANRENLANAEKALSLRLNLRSQDSSAKTELSTSSLAISVYEADVRRSMASLENIDAQLALTALRSPIDGVISRKAVFAGETAQAGKELLRVTSTTSFRAVADVDEKYVWQLSPGQSVVVQPEAFPELTIQGKIEEIGREANPEKGTVLVRISLSSSDPRLRSDLTLDVNVTTLEVSNAFVVPGGSVIREGEEAFVMVIESGVVTRRPVVLDRQTETGDLVKSGLQSGDEIIKDPRSVKAGDKAKAGGGKE